MNEDNIRNTVETISKIPIINPAVFKSKQKNLCTIFDWLKSRKRKKGWFKLLFQNKKVKFLTIKNL